MAIDLPPLPRGTTYNIRTISAANTLNPAFGGPRQRLARKGSRFAIDVSIPALSLKGCGRALIADLIRGETEPVSVIIPQPGVHTTGLGAPLVNGSGHAGSFLPVKNFTPEIVLPKGLWLSITTSGQRFLYMLTNEAYVPPTPFSMPIWPMLRRPPANNDVIEVAAPRIEGFVAPSSEWSVARIGSVGISFTIEERE